MPRNSLMTHGIEGALASIPVIGPLLAPFTQRVVDAIEQEQGRRTSLALQAAEMASGMTREDIEELLVQDHEALSLTIQLLYVAGMNGHEDILLQMGQIAGTGWANPNLCAEMEDILKASSQMGPGQLRVLLHAQLKEEIREQKERTLRAEKDISSDDLDSALHDAWAAAAWSAKEVQQEMNISIELVNANLARLTALGMIQEAIVQAANAPLHGGGYFEITPLGKLIVTAGREADAAKGGVGLR